MATQLSLVPQPPSTEDVLREALAGRDEAMRTVAAHDKLILELGQRLWHEQNPGQRRFMKVRAEEARRMVGL